MGLFEKEDRDSFINGLTNHMEELAGCKKKGGWIVFSIHSLFILVIAYQVFLTNSAITVGMGAIVWITLVLFHCAFDGCFLVRLERSLFESQEWYFIWTIFPEISKMIGNQMSHSDLSTLQNIIGITLTIIVIWRTYVVISKNKTPSVIDLDNNEDEKRK